MAVDATVEVGVKFKPDERSLDAIVREAAKVQEKGMSELYIPSEFLYKEELPIFATGKADIPTLKKWVMEEIK